MVEAAGFSVSLTWWIKAPIIKLVCPNCNKKTENYVLGSDDGTIKVRCMKCGIIYDHDKSKNSTSESVAEDSPDLPCYG